MWKYLCPMWMLIKRWLQQRRILAIKWVAWPILWIPIGLFSQPHLLFPKGLTNQVAVVAMSHHRLPLTNTDLVSASAKCPICHTGDQHRAPDMVLFSRVISRLPGWLHWPVFIMDKAMVCSYWNGHLFWVWICLPCTQCFCSNCHGVSYSIASDDKTNFIGN